LGIRLSDFAALILIWIEKLTLHVFPIQDGIGGILEPLKAKLEVFDVIEVILDRLPDDLGSFPRSSARSAAVTASIRQPLITPALFSHRPPPDWEKRENSKKSWGDEGLPAW